jgi:DNA-directed RNA polymerase specialized sigma24 family protein
MGLEPATARSRLHRARARLREQLAVHGFTPDLERTR